MSSKDQELVDSFVEGSALDLDHFPKLREYFANEALGELSPLQEDPAETGVLKELETFLKIQREGEGKDEILMSKEELKLIEGYIKEMCNGPPREKFQNGVCWFPEQGCALLCEQTHDRRELKLSLLYLTDFKETLLIDNGDLRQNVKLSQSHAVLHLSDAPERGTPVAALCEEMKKNADLGKTPAVIQKEILATYPSKPSPKDSFDLEEVTPSTPTTWPLVRAVLEFLLSISKGQKRARGLVNRFFTLMSLHFLCARLSQGKESDTSFDAIRAMQLRTARDVQEHSRGQKDNLCKQLCVAISRILETSPLSFEQSSSFSSIETFKDDIALVSHPFLGNYQVPDKAEPHRVNRDERSQVDVLLCAVKSHIPSQRSATSVWEWFLQNKKTAPRVFLLDTIEVFFWEIACHQLSHGSNLDDDSDMDSLFLLADAYCEQSIKGERNARQDLEHMAFLPAECLSKRTLIRFIVACVAFLRAQAEWTDFKDNFCPALVKEALFFLVLSDRDAQQAAKSVFKFLAAECEEKSPVFGGKSTEYDDLRLANFLYEKEQDIKDLAASMWKESNEEVDAKWRDTEDKKRSYEALEKEIEEIRMESAGLIARKQNRVREGPERRQLKKDLEALDKKIKNLQKKMKNDFKLSPADLDAPHQQNDPMERGYSEDLQKTAAFRTLPRSLFDLALSTFLAHFEAVGKDEEGESMDIVKQSSYWSRAMVDQPWLNRGKDYSLVVVSLEAKSFLGAELPDMSKFIDRDGTKFDNIRHPVNVTLLLSFRDSLVDPFVIGNDTSGQSRLCDHLASRFASYGLNLESTLRTTFEAICIIPEADAETRNLRRGNEPYAARVAAAQELKLEFRHFKRIANLRAYPKSQLRRLNALLSDTEYPLDNPFVEIIVQLCLFQLGPMQLTHEGKVKLSWRAEKAGFPLLKVLKDLSSTYLHEEKNANKLFVVGQIASYFSQPFGTREDHKDTEAFAQLSEVVADTLGDIAGTVSDAPVAARLSARSMFLFAHRQLSPGPSLDKLLILSRKRHIYVLRCAGSLNFSQVQTLESLAYLPCCRNKEEIVARFSAETPAGYLDLDTSESTAAVESRHRGKANDNDSDSDSDSLPDTDDSENPEETFVDERYATPWEPVDGTYGCFEFKDSHGTEYHLNCLIGQVLFQLKPPTYLPQEIQEECCYRENHFESKSFWNSTSTGYQKDTKVDKRETTHIFSRTQRGGWVYEQHDKRNALLLTYVENKDWKDIRELFTGEYSMWHVKRRLRNGTDALPLFDLDLFILRELKTGNIAYAIYDGYIFEVCRPGKVKTTKLVFLKDFLPKPDGKSSSSANTIAGLLQRIKGQEDLRHQKDGQEDVWTPIWTRMSKLSLRMLVTGEGVRGSRIISVLESLDTPKHIKISLTGSFSYEFSLIRYDLTFTADFGKRGEESARVLCKSGIFEGFSLAEPYSQGVFKKLPCHLVLQREGSERILLPDLRVDAPVHRGSRQVTVLSRLFRFRTLQADSRIGTLVLAHNLLKSSGKGFHCDDEEGLPGHMLAMDQIRQLDCTYPLEVLEEQVLFDILQHSTPFPALFLLVFGACRNFAALKNRTPEDKWFRKAALVEELYVKEALSELRAPLRYPLLSSPEEKALLSPRKAQELNSQTTRFPKGKLKGANRRKLELFTLSAEKLLDTVGEMLASQLEQPQRSSLPSSSQNRSALSKLFCATPSMRRRVSDSHPSQGVEAGTGDNPRLTKIEEFEEGPAERVINDSTDDDVVFQQADFENLDLPNKLVFPPDSALRTTPLGSIIVGELNNSYRAMQEFRESKRVEVDEKMAEAILRVVEKYLEDVRTSAEGLYTHIVSCFVAESGTLEDDFLQSGGQQLPVRWPELVQIVCMDDIETRMAGFPLEQDKTAVKHSILTWMKLCVLGDKLSDLKNLCESAAKAAEKRPHFEGIRDELMATWKEWNPSDYPEWLVFELVSMKRIRPKQAEVALSLINKQKDTGCTLAQLDVGLGKTSMVLPMLALYYGRCNIKGDWPVRIHLLESIFRETCRKLQQTLAQTGLPCQLIHLKFSRKIKLTNSTWQGSIRNLESLFMSTRRNYWTVFCLTAEDRLSLQLRADEMEDRIKNPNDYEDLQMDGAAKVEADEEKDSNENENDGATEENGEERENVGEDDCGKLSIESTRNALASLRKLTDLSFVDIYDECDELLHHRFQLVYSLGKQQVIPDLKPRVLALQLLLELFCKMHFGSHKDLKDFVRREEISVQWRYTRRKDRMPGEFPGIQLQQDLSDENKERLNEELVTALFKDPPRELVALLDMNSSACKQFLLDKELSEEVKEQVGITTNDLDEHDIVSEPQRLLLGLRGLVRSGIFVLCLQRQHRTHYGIPTGHFTREDRPHLAVPFRANEVPSKTSSFSHPDTLLAYTHLAYYYDGLSFLDFRTALEKLVSLGQHADRIWKQWAADVEEGRHKMPVPRDLRQVNPQNEDFVKKLHGKLFKSTKVINFWLQNIALPQDAKEFPKQIKKSAWDLVGDATKFPCIGFSGTTESKFLLPLGVRVLRPRNPEIQATDGLMVERFLAQSDDRVLQIKFGESLESKTCSLIEVCIDKENGFQALIDAGALLNGIDLKEFARKLLNSPGWRDSGFEAIAFFDTDIHNDWIYWTEANAPTKRITSAEQSRNMFVIYDQARCRGADLVLPSNAKALVTVGSLTTKDMLIQAVGRLRQLDRGQRFCIGTDIDTFGSICRFSRLEDPEQATSEHVLVWALETTVKELNKGLFRYFANGQSYLPGVPVGRKNIRHSQRRRPLVDSRGSSSSVFDCLQKPLGFLKKQQAMLGERFAKKRVTPRSNSSFVTTKMSFFSNRDWHLHGARMSLQGRSKTITFAHISPASFLHNGVEDLYLKGMNLVELSQRVGQMKKTNNFSKQIAANLDKLQTKVTELGKGVYVIAGSELGHEDENEAEFEIEEDHEQEEEDQEEVDHLDDLASFEPLNERNLFRQGRVDYNSVRSFMSECVDTGTFFMLADFRWPSQLPLYVTHNFIHVLRANATPDSFRCRLRKLDGVLFFMDRHNKPALLLISEREVELAIELLQADVEAPYALVNWDLVRLQLPTSENPSGSGWGVSQKCLDESMVLGPSSVVGEFAEFLETNADLLSALDILAGRTDPFPEIDVQMSSLLPIESRALKEWLKWTETYHTWEGSELQNLYHSNVVR